MQPSHMIQATLNVIDINALEIVNDSALYKCSLNNNNTNNNKWSWKVLENHFQCSVCTLI